MTEKDIETFRYRAMDHVVAWMTRDRYPTALLAGGLALLGKNLMISIIEIIAERHSEWETISLPSFGLPEGIGLALVMASLGFRVLPTLETNKKQRYQAARKLYREYDELTPAELQTRFSFVFGVPAPPYEALTAWIYIASIRVMTRRLATYCIFS